MKVTVTTRHIKDTKTAEKIKAYALKKTRRIERYVGTDKDSADLRFVLSSEKFRDKAEMILSAGHIKATSSVESNDMYAAIDSVVDTIIKQLKKQNEKITKEKRRIGARSKEEITEQFSTESYELTDLKIHKLPQKPMSREEASLQLKVSDANFVAFRNSENGEMNVIYLSRRGQKILIEP
ncbi:MAG: ribosome-associated translation inhibitor RaiA [Thermodesulfobacteriota bacterium]